MATCQELKTIAKARLKSVNTLILAKDWHCAAYMMGYVLECALKASTCKALRLVSYPENTKNLKISSYFMTHKFDELLVVSGLEDVFSSRGPAFAWKNWGEFSLEYAGDWPSMRYDPKRVWNETKVKKLLYNLIQPEYGIISIIRDKKRW